MRLRPRRLSTAPGGKPGAIGLERLIIIAEARRAPFPPDLCLLEQAGAADAFAAVQTTRQGGSRLMQALRAAGLADGSTRAANPDILIDDEAARPSHPPCHVLRFRSAPAGIAAAIVLFTPCRTGHVMMRSCALPASSAEPRVACGSKGSSDTSPRLASCIIVEGCEMAQARMTACPARKGMATMARPLRVSGTRPA